MSTATRQITKVTATRPVKKLQKPRPLKTQNANKHSGMDTSMSLFEDIMILADMVTNNLTNGNIDRTLQEGIISLSNMLKNYGENLELIYKDQLDRAFVTFRNGCRDENVDYISRLHLLELIELRAMGWNITDLNSYYKHKCSHQDMELSISSIDSSVTSSNSPFSHTQMTNSLSPVATQPLLLGPDELVKSSGKFAAPTKIPGKNYCKDEVVIRNSDSGKVMGIKGRRVHMIEQLSETVISFQKVNPGAKERLVQITGLSEGKITYAKQLMEDTIRRNASPVQTDLHDKERLGSSSSLNSSTSDDSLRYKSVGSKRSTLLHSFSTNDASLGEYKYTVTVGDSNLKITGNNLDLVRIAKLVLDEYFSLNANDCTTEYDVEEGTILFEPVINSDSARAFTSQDSEESEDTYKAQNSVSSDVAKSPSLKKITQPSSIKLYTEETLPAPASGKENVAPADGSKKAAAKNIKTYTFEEIWSYVESPLSRKMPTGWDVCSKNFSVVAKKLPIKKWIDRKSFFEE